MDMYTPIFIAAGFILFVGLLFLGYQIYITLVQVRQTLTKADRVLDDAGKIGDSIVSIPTMLSSFLGQASKGVVDRILPPPRKRKES